MPYSTRTLKSLDFTLLLFLVSLVTINYSSPNQEMESEKLLFSITILFISLFHMVESKEVCVALSQARVEIFF